MDLTWRLDFNEAVCRLALEVCIGLRKEDGSLMRTSEFHIKRENRKVRL